MSIEKWREFWDARYAETEPVYGERPNRFLVEHFTRLNPGSRVYCPADGYGRNALWLAEHGMNVCLVDLSVIAVERAKRVAWNWGILLSAEVENLADYEPPEHDASVWIYAHFPPAVRQEIHRRAWARLTPNGIWIMEVFNPGQLKRNSGGPKDKSMLYTPQMIREDLPEAEFEVLETQTIELDEGPYHQGKAEVLRVLAFKRMHHYVRG